MSPTPMRSDKNPSLQGGRRRKWARLRSFNYTGTFTYSLTLCCARKRKLLTEARVVDALIAILHEIAREHGFEVWAYCFMPDHLHLLVEGIRTDSSLRSFIRAFRYKASVQARPHTRGPLWQMGYYDHVLRKDEAVANVARYIFQNPVRAGWVNDYRDYPFSGSFCADWRAL